MTYNVFGGTLSLNQSISHYQLRKRQQPYIPASHCSLFAVLKLLYQPLFILNMYNPLMVILRFFLHQFILHISCFAFYILCILCILFILLMFTL